jgi:hypothetical protein
VPAGLINRSTAWARGATALAIATRCRFIASVLQAGRTRAATRELKELDRLATEQANKGGRCWRAEPWIRPIHRLALLSEQQIKRGAHRSVAELEVAITA